MSHYKKMPVEDWIKVEDNPIQRDTERHAAKAKHLMTPHPTHSFVFAAELPNGKLIKLDGHTRALLWKRKEVAAPIQVTVGIIPVDTKEEVELLYKDFDSRDALETMRDKVSGAFNRYGFELQSTMVSSGNLTSALRIAYRILMNVGPVQGLKGGGSISTGKKTIKDIAKADIYTMVNEFSYELYALDGFGLQQGRMSAGGVAAFIVSYRRHGHKITPFWTGVFANKGSKHAGQMDAIQAVCELFLSRKKNFGGSAAIDLCARTLTGVEKWLKDELSYSIPRPMDTSGYLVGHAAPNERLIKKHNLEKARIDRERKG